MPLLWGDRVIGWANVTRPNGRVDVETGFVAPRPRDRTFRRRFDAEVARMEAFLGRGLG
jgi:hypothetical protein